MALMRYKILMQRYEKTVHVPEKRTNNIYIRLILSVLRSKDRVRKRERKREVVLKNIPYLVNNENFLLA